MATSVVSITMDSETKQAMERVCEELGMSVSTAFTIFAKKVGREHRIPFDVSLDPFYSSENLEHIHRSRAEIEAGEGIIHELIEIDED